MKVKLGEIAVLINGDRGKNYPSQADIVSDGEIPFVNAGHLNGRSICFDEMNYISKEKYDSLNSGKFFAGDILYCLRGSLGKKAAVKGDVFGAVASSLVIIRPDSERINADYLMYALDSPSIHEQLARANNGSSQPNLSAASVKSYNIDLPDKEIQERIVERLSKLRFIIDARQKEMDCLNGLIKARFVEMFGDPETNCNEYPLKKLDNLVTDIIAGWSANGEARQKKDDEKAVLKVSAVTQGFFKPEEHKALPSDIEIKKYVFPHRGDLLFSRANTRELVGATAIIEHDYPDLLLPDKLWRVLFTNEINVYYAKYVLSTESIRNKFSAQSTGTSGSMFNVSSEKFRDITIPVPSRALQDDFERFVSQVDKSKVAVQNALDRSQLLFDSLMQQYFG